MFTYQAVVARQSDKHKVLVFSAKASDILKFAEIDRINRDEKGTLQDLQKGFILLRVLQRDFGLSVGESQSTTALPHAPGNHPLLPRFPPKPGPP